MAANTYWFTKAFLNAFGGVDGSKGINFKNDEISVALLDDTYTPNQASHESWADVSAYEISGTGYTSGGQVLANKIISSNDLNVILTADNPSWDPSSLVARWLVIYKSAPEADADKLLLGYMDLEENLMSKNGPFEIQWNTDGMLMGATQPQV
jgi:hypothetical protein